MLSNNYRAIRRKNNASQKFSQERLKNILNKKRDSAGSSNCNSNLPSVGSNLVAISRKSKSKEKKQGLSLGPVLSGGNLKIPQNLKVLDFSVRKL